MTCKVAPAKRIAWVVALVASVGCSQAFSAHCAVTSNSVGFGSYDTLSPVPTDATATIQVVCDQPAPYVIKFGPGLNSSGNAMQRQMRSPDGRTPLFYNLFLDGGFSILWGDGTGGTTPFFSNGQAREGVLVYGRIPPLQGVAAGVYSDSVTVTVEW